MKKILWCIPATAVIGLVAAFLRARELAFGFDFITGLPVDKLWITPCLMIVAVLLAAVGLVLTWKKIPEAKEAKKSPIYTGAALFGAAVMLALAGYAVLTNETGELIPYLLAGLSVANAMAFALLGMKNMSENDHPIYLFFTFLSILWATLVVIMVFRVRVSEPVAEHFVFLLFAVLAILIFTYAQIGYVFGKNRFAVAFISGLLGIYFTVIEIVAPFIANGMNKAFYLTLDFNILLPMIAYLVYIPAALFKMYRNENNIE